MFWDAKISFEFLSDIIGDVQEEGYTRVYPKVPGLVAWSENCKWYSSLPLGSVGSLFCGSV
jgi:hypothetical protein